MHSSTWGTCPGGVPAQGVYLSGGTCPGDVPAQERVPAGGRVPAMYPPCGQTDTCKNITEVETDAD